VRSPAGRLVLERRGVGAGGLVDVPVLRPVGRVRRIDHVVGRLHLVVLLGHGGILRGGCHRPGVTGGRARSARNPVTQLETGYLARTETRFPWQKPGFKAAAHGWPLSFLACARCSLIVGSVLVAKSLSPGSFRLRLAFSKSFTAFSWSSTMCLV